MATGPAWLTLRLKISGRDSEYLKNKLLAATTVGSQLADGRATRKVAVAASNLLAALASGVLKGKLWVEVTSDSGTYPTGAIACTQANAAGNYVRWTYGALTITLAEGTDFLRGASDTTCATNLAAAINAHPVLGSLYTAAGDAGDCELTGKIPGAALTDIAMSTDDATAFGITALSGGTEGAAKVFMQQVWQNLTR
jgi:hypothetical protein